MTAKFSSFGEKNLLRMFQKEYWLKLPQFDQWRFHKASFFCFEPKWNQTAFWTKNFMVKEKVILNET